MLKDAKLWRLHIQRRRTSNNGEQEWGSKKASIILSPIQLNLLGLTKSYKCEYEMRDLRMEKKDGRREDNSIRQTLIRGKYCGWGLSEINSRIWVNEVCYLKQVTFSWVWLGCHPPAQRKKQITAKCSVSAIHILNIAFGVLSVLGFSHVNP